MTSASSSETAGPGRADAGRADPGRGSNLAGRYAIALYDLAAEQGVLDQTVEQVTALDRLLRTAPEIRKVITTPTIRQDEARSAFDAALAAEGFSELIRRFVGTAIANRRLRQLPELTTGFLAHVAEKRGIVVADVNTAHPLTDTQKVQLTARLTEAGYPKVELREHVDPELLGGLVVKIGARLYDTSLRSRLQRLRHAMRQPQPGQSMTKGAA